MGGFHVVVEVTSRDIIRLLTRARVSDEIVGEVRSKLTMLMNASYNEVDMRREAHLVPAADVCASIVSDIVAEVCNVRVPLVEAERLERENSEWMHRYSMERRLRRAYEVEIEFKEGKMDRMEQAQLYMMNSYFKEARLLRQQLETQSEKYEKQLAVAQAAQSSSAFASPSNHQGRKRLSKGASFHRSQTASHSGGAISGGAFGGIESTSSPVTSAVASPMATSLAVVSAAVAISSTGGLPVAITSSQEFDNATGVFDGPSSLVTIAPQQSRGDGAADPLLPARSAAFVEGLTGSAVFDYERYVRLIDDDIAQWPLRLKEKQDELDRLHAEHSVEAAATAARHRQELLEKDRAIKLRDDYLQHLTGHAQSIIPAVKETMRKGRSDLRHELDEIKIASVEFSQEVKRALGILAGHLRDTESRMEVFLRFVGHCSQVLQDAVSRVQNGQRVNATKGPPLWHFFLLRGDSDPDEEAKLFWQQSALVKAVLASYKDVLFKMEDISKMKAPSVYDRVGDPGVVDEFGNLRRRSTRSGRTGVVSDESGTGTDEDDDDADNDTHSAAPSTIPPASSRSNHRRLGPFTDDDAAAPEWMTASTGFQPGRRRHEKFVAPRQRQRLPSNTSSNGKATVTAAAYSVSTGGAPRRPDTRAHGRGPRSSIAVAAPTTTSGNSDPTWKEGGKAALGLVRGGGDSRKERERMGMTSSEEQMARRLVEQKSIVARATLQHVMRRVVLAARRRAYFKKLPKIVKNAVTVLQHFDDDIFTEGVEIERMRKRMDHLRHNLGAISCGQPPVPFAAFAKRVDAAQAQAQQQAQSTPSVIAAIHPAGAEKPPQPRGNLLSGAASLAVTPRQEALPSASVARDRELFDDLDTDASEPAIAVHQPIVPSTAPESDDNNLDTQPLVLHATPPPSSAAKEVEIGQPPLQLVEPAQSPSLQPTLTAENWVRGPFVDTRGNRLFILADGRVVYVGTGQHGFAAGRLVQDCGGRFVSVTPPSASDVESLRASLAFAAESTNHSEVVQDRHQIPAAMLTVHNQTPPPTRDAAPRAGPSIASRAIPGGGPFQRPERSVATDEAYARTAAIANLAEALARDGPFGFAGTDTDRDLLRITSLEPAPSVYVPQVAALTSRSDAARSRDLLLARAEDGPHAPPLNLRSPIVMSSAAARVLNATAAQVAAASGGGSPMTPRQPSRASSSRSSQRPQSKGRLSLPPL